MKISTSRQLSWNSVALTLALAIPAAGLLPAAAHAVSLTPVGSRINISNNFNPDFWEASGLGLAKNEGKLWSVSDDDFTMYKMNLDGSADESFDPTPASGVGTLTHHDFEGVTYAPQPPGSSNDHYIYLANEDGNAILPVNYDSQKYHQQAALSSMAGYNTVRCLGTTLTVAQEFNASSTASGLEGITWNGDLNSFFVVKEKDPGLMIQINQALTQILACRLLTFSGHDYSDINYDATRQRYWIVSDEAQAVYLYNWSTNTVDFTYSLGYPHGEGVSYDPDNHRLYIVTDNGQGQNSYLYTYNVQ